MKTSNRRAQIASPMRSKFRPALAAGLVVLATVLALPAASVAEDSPGARQVAAQIAEAYGIGDFSKVEEIYFTFRLESPEKEIERRWVWYPKTGRVNAENESMIYNRNDQLNASEKRVDALFTNDEYWLLFPFHLVWDKGTTLTLSEDLVSSPLSGSELRMLTVQYGPAGGYTPGDAYDLFFEPGTYTVREWAYRPGGQPRPARLSAWAQPRDVMGFKFATEHESTGGFKISFPEIRIVRSPR